MEIRYSKQAYKYLMKLHKPKREKIEAAINQLPQGYTVKLKGFDNLYRLRVDSYRVIYTATYDIIKVEKIGSRGDVYND